jgi:DNA-directed RNA polymerase specialized sigma24 family protein
VARVKIWLSGHAGVGAHANVRRQQAPILIKPVSDDMSISAKIAPHLPYLRRFGRALTGSQESGDAYVVATLESFVADPKTFSTDVDPRIALYRSFVSLWNSVDLNLAPTRNNTDHAGRSLDSITPLPRQAFLLTSVEGFSPRQAAEILDAPIERLSGLLEQAGREIAEQVATDVLIIEDEPLIAMDLESIVQDLGHTVSGLARTRAEAIAAVQASRPGLVLADIQLADGSSGLDAINEILLGFEVPVIFITAFPERLLTGERPEPTFLITKPFDINTVRAVISQALFFGTAARLPGGRLDPKSLTS